ncbi:hypothetical protein HPB50_024781 [Hyalomma asiaticum]|uniref:Uncharacterized protein n=1 Tax=Hyalomma asiaticum TaxID=266040 RepID=A0ACB7TC49_HYAAI|nr:hypothetical protein HPB50_024781 [Hyalomma asiaticum]
MTTTQYDGTVVMVQGYQPAVVPAPELPQAAPVELVPVVAEGKEQKPSGMWWTTVLLCTMTFLLVGTTVAAVILVANARTHSSQTEMPDNAKSGGVNRGGPVFGQDIEVVVNQPSGSGSQEPPRPPQHYPSQPAKSTKRTYVPVAAPSEGSVADQMPLVCIMGEKTSSPNAFPDDGLCDYIFFDSLYKARPQRAVPAVHLQQQSQQLHQQPPRLPEHAPRSRLRLQTAKEDLKVKNPSPLQPFWNAEVLSVGIFDTPSWATGNQTRAALAVLKEIDDLLDMQKQQGKHVVTALAVPDPQLDWSLSYSIDLSDVGLNLYMFIAISHYTYGDNTLRNCVIMPPTRHPDDFPEEEIARDYNFDLSTSLFAISELYLRRATQRGLFSVTMKGRWNVPLSTENVDFMSKCVSDLSLISFGSYTEVCPKQSGGKTGYKLTYSENHCAMLAYAPDIPRVLAYDNEDGLAIKMCGAKGLYKDLKYGVAVFDIDYDDHDNQCGTLNRFGRYSRLKQVKKTLDYMRLNSGPSFNEETCVEYGT